MGKIAGTILLVIGIILTILNILNRVLSPLPFRGTSIAEVLTVIVGIALIVYGIILYRK